MASFLKQFTRSLRCSYSAFSGSKQGHPIVLMALLAAGCVPSGQLNRMIAERKANPPEIILPVHHTPTPANINYVYDYEGLFSSLQQRKLDTLLRTFETSNLIPIKLSTVNAAIAAGPADSIGGYNKQSLKDWDFVHGRSKNSMSVTISKSFGRVAVDYGDGVKRFLSDEEVNNAFNNNYFPLAQKGNYFQAVYTTLTTLMDDVRKNVSFNPQPAQ
ncbi:MAG: TPM domain-containing protein [Niabella sp.]